VSNNFKLRTLFVTPEEDKRTFWYGLNFEFDFPSKFFAQTRFATEIRPLIGWRTMESAQWDLVVNPIVHIGFGSFGDIDFAGCAPDVKPRGGATVHRLPRSVKSMYGPTVRQYRSPLGFSEAIRSCKTE
jgi:hypothetical protein